MSHYDHSLKQVPQDSKVIGRHIDGIINLHAIPSGIPRTKLYRKLKWVVKHQKPVPTNVMVRILEPQPVPLLGKRKREKKDVSLEFHAHQIVTELGEPIHIYQAVHVRQIPHHGAFSTNPVRTQHPSFSRGYTM